MAYPEKNASYRNRPAWMDRAQRAETEKGGVLTPMDTGPQQNSAQDEVPRDLPVRAK
jgi:hypothetical protein